MKKLLNLITLASQNEMGPEWIWWIDSPVILFISSIFFRYSQKVISYTLDKHLLVTMVSSFIRWIAVLDDEWSNSGADPGFGQGGGPQLLRPKVADIAKWSRASEASFLRPGSRARLRALEAFGFLMLKYAFSHILETLFLLFLTSILTPKVDKNRALDFTSINLRHSDMLHLFFNLHEKVMI